MRALVLMLVCQLALAQSPTDTCVGCHGARGEGNAQMGAPTIAGQPRAYLERQLAAYADGRRENQVMSPIAKQLSPQQRNAVADHYAQLAPPAKPRSAATGASAAAPAVALATRGDDSRELQACANCHGPDGIGMADINPYLAGLDERYLQAALVEWKKGQRRTDPSAQMPRIAAALTDAEIKALAGYYAGLPPPPAIARTKPAPAQAESTLPGAGATPRRGGGEVTGGEPYGSQGPGGAGSR